MLRLLALLALIQAAEAGITLEFGTKKKPPPQKAKAVVEKKEEELAVARAQREAFDLCQPVCQCGFCPCPQAALKLCPTCGDIKKHLCRKAACVAARPLES